MTLAITQYFLKLFETDIVVLFSHTVSSGPLKCSCPFYPLKIRVSIDISARSGVCDFLALNVYIYINFRSGAIIYVYPLVHMCPSFQ